MPSRRQSRVGDLLREELADLILREVHDPRLAEITSITHVDVAPDLSSARVHVSILGTEAEKVQTLQGLEAAASFLRRSLKERLDLRRIPLLAFVRDESIEGGARLLARMKKAGARERGGPNAGPASRSS
jgi:ribosome-binding factor A